MLTPFSVGAYFDSFSRSCSSTCRNRVSSPIASSAVRALPTDRVGAQQETQRLDDVVDRPDRVERRPRQPGQPLAADRREDRVDQAIEPASWSLAASRQLVGVGILPRGGRRVPAGRRRRERPTAASAVRG